MLEFYGPAICASVSPKSLSTPSQTGLLANEPFTSDDAEARERITSDEMKP